MDDAEIISSRENQHLVRARRVRDGRERRLIFVEGKRTVAEALRSPLAIEECLVSASLGDDELLASVQKKGIPARRVSEKAFGSVSDTETTQGIILIALRPRRGLEELNASGYKGVPIVIFLQNINNPANLGAVARAAEAAGVMGMITSRGSADAFSPKSVRSGMGSLFRLPVREGMSLDAAVEWARSAGFSIAAADISGKRPYTAVNWREPRLLIIGSEAHGLTANDLALADEVFNIPMAPPVESLNLAVAAGICLFEARRQIGA